VLNGFHPLQPFSDGPKMSKVPSFDQLMNPLLKALKDLGGSGSIDEIYEKVSQNTGLSNEILGILHNPEKSNKTEIEYRLAWTRTYLKNYGILEKSRRGVWAIASDKRHISEVDPKEVVRAVRSLARGEKAEKLIEEDSGDPIIPTPVSEPLSWRAQLHLILTKELDPSAFERLIQRLLRESGFVQVEVTGRTGDGGIDGKGIARIHGLLSFHVVFQCKRYTGAVSAPDIRDFRGAMVGRADKGLFVTTGTFTRDAIKEALRDGAPPIDLVDGDQLAVKLKELSLGVRTQQVEKIIVEHDWFKTI
jgi:restriction system protein